MPTTCAERLDKNSPLLCIHFGDFGVAAGQAPEDSVYLKDGNIIGGVYEEVHEDTIFGEIERNVSAALLKGNKIPELTASGVAHQK